MINLNWDKKIWFGGGHAQRMEKNVQMMKETVCFFRSIEKYFSSQESRLFL